MNPAGPIGAADRTILLDSLAIMLCIVVPVIAATLAFTWWYRPGNPRAVYRPDFAYSGRIELVTWSVPVLTILFLGGITWVGSHQLDPARPIRPENGMPVAKPLDVQVVSLDWKWLFIYPDAGVASVNRLVIPAGTPIHFHLTSASVMNAFFVPRLGSMIYAMNGMETQLHLQSDRPGRYMGLASHFSGDGFSDMHFEVDAVPAGAFTDWLAASGGASPVLDRAAYQKLTRQSEKLPPARFDHVEPGLFEAIVSQAIPPAPGPDREDAKHVPGAAAPVSTPKEA